MQLHVAGSLRITRGKKAGESPIPEPCGDRDRMIACRRFRALVLGHRNLRRFPWTLCSIHSRGSVRCRKVSWKEWRPARQPPSTSAWPRIAAWSGRAAP